MKLFSAPQSYTPLQTNTCPSPRPTVQARSGHLFEKLIPVAESTCFNWSVIRSGHYNNLKTLTEKQLAGYLKRLKDVFSYPQKVNSCVWEDELEFLIDLCKNSPEHHLNLAGNKLFYGKKAEGKKTEYTLLFEQIQGNAEKHFIRVHPAFYRLIEDLLQDSPQESILQQIKQRHPQGFASLERTTVKNCDNPLARGAWCDSLTILA